MFGTVLTTGLLAAAFMFYITTEKCDPQWITFNSTGLLAELENKLFGQHIASPIILRAVKGFMRSENPMKPLVLSLHGPTGTGKSFVSKLIAQNIYKEGMDSSFVHFFISTVHFPHKSEIDTYKSQLQQWIKGNVTKCERSMFIFDEMDKMHPGLIDSIKPYLDYNKVGGVSYQKAIFIFLSNAGAEVIVQTALDLLRAGREREEIELKDLETLLADLGHSSLVEKNVVDFFIPFLPLEREHVVQCAMAELKAGGHRPDQTVAESVASDFQYFPKFDRVFSVSGCKLIANKLLFYI